MNENEILQEIRRVREEHARECNYNVHVMFEQMRAETEQLKAEGWSLEGGHGFPLLEKLRTNATPLGAYVNGKFYYGIKTGLNEAFVIDRDTRDRLIREDRNALELIRPWIEFAATMNPPIPL